MWLLLNSGPAAWSVCEKYIVNIRRIINKQTNRIHSIYHIHSHNSSAIIRGLVGVLIADMALQNVVVIRAHGAIQTLIHGDTMQ